jgi:hypothetical protein
VEGNKTVTQSNSNPKSETLDLDTLSGNSQPVQNDAALVRTPRASGNVIHDTYQQFTKRVWLLDYSSSMLDSIASLNLNRASQTKTALLKEIVCDNIDEKLGQYGDNVLLQCYKFHGHTSPLTGANLEGLKRTIRETSADGWSTDLMHALDAGISQCELFPSPVNTHQVLMVTDGLDAGAADAPSLIPRCKVRNITVDVIWIRSKHEPVDSSVLDGLRRLCVETGGQFIEASTIEDVRRGFISTANRLCLPPASA